MTAPPVLSIVVLLPSSSTEVSDLLRSVLRERSIAIEIVVAADIDRHIDIAANLGTLSLADDRVRVIATDASQGRSSALDAALDACRAPWVTVVDANGLVADGGYAALVGSLQASGSAMAVGVAESIERRRHRIIRAADGALDSDAAGISVASRPGLIGDDLLCGKVISTTLLRSAVDANEVWLEGLVVARLYAAAPALDVLARTVVFCRARASQSTAVPMSEAWVSERSRIWATVEHAPRTARARYAQLLIEREMVSDESTRTLAGRENRGDLAEFLVSLTRDLDETSLANLPIWRRWQLALVAVGQSGLVDVAAANGRRTLPHDVPMLDPTNLQSEAWRALGLREDEELRDAVIERFVTGPSQSVATSSDAIGIEVSIVIPTYNVAPYVDDLLESIRASVGVSFEIIVVDDNSSDDTWNRVLKHADTDSRVRPVRSAGVGGGQARATGIELARGEYLAFADGDDLVPPRAYAELLAVARRSRADVVSGSYLKFFTTSTWDARTGFNHAYALPLESVSLDTHPQLVRHRAVWNRLVRRDHWLATAFPFPGVPRSNDIVAMTSAFLSAKSVAVSSVQTYVYRDRPGNGSMTSAIGSTDYTVSYFSEESTCAALVQQHGSLPVSREYWSMVLRRDAWTNTLKYLELRTGEPENDARVAEQISALMSRVPQAEFALLKPEQQSVWALAAAGQFDAASTMSRLEKHAASVPAEALIRAVSLADGERLVPRVSINSMVLKYLIRQIISEAGWSEERLALALPVIRRRLDDPHLPLTPAPFSLEERFARAISNGTVDLPKAVRPVNATPVDVAFTGVTSMTLRIARQDIAPSEAVRVVASRYRRTRAARAVISHFVADGEGWAASITTSMFPGRGVWRLELEYENHQGLCRTAVKLKNEASRLVPMRLRSLVPVKAGRDTSLLRVKEPFGTRVRHRVRALVAGRAGGR